MKKGINTLFLPILLGCTLFTPLALAQDPAPATMYSSPSITGESYGTTVGRKLGSGFSNMTMGWIEIPKNTLNVTNDIDTKYVIFGVVGGLLKGTLHTLGRTLTGVIDVITFPLPTKPMIRPDYVWDKFGTDTTYGPYFILTDSPGDVQTETY